MRNSNYCVVSPHPFKNIRAKFQGNILVTFIWMKDKRRKNKRTNITSACKHSWVNYARIRKTNSRWIFCAYLKHYIRFPPLRKDFPVIRLFVGIRNFPGDIACYESTSVILGFIEKECEKMPENLPAFPDKEVISVQLKNPLV